MKRMAYKRTATVPEFTYKTTPSIATELADSILNMHVGLLAEVHNKYLHS